MRKKKENANQRAVETGVKKKKKVPTEVRQKTTTKSLLALISVFRYESLNSNHGD